MMPFAKLWSPRIAAASVAVMFSLSACGGDSTGPSKLDSSAALQSLALGMGSILGAQPIGASMDASFGGIAPLLDQIDVTIDGKSQSMFALGVRESFPEGTCEEDLFVFPSIPPDNAVCTPPPFGLGLFLWQAHSGSALPDRLIFINADIGTSNFDFFSTVTLAPGSTPSPLPAVAMYMQDVDNFWISVSGSIISQVAGTSQSCDLPLPPYAKAGSCSVATFDEQGTITFEEVSETGPTARRLNLTIPRQTIHGLLQAITETQRVSDPWGYTRVPGLQLQLNETSVARGAAIRTQVPTSRDH